MPAPSLRDIYVKLFTSEDAFNLHKTLGIFCLLHFIFRFAQVGETDMGFNTSLATLMSIAAHTLLSVSSLIFKIPSKRIASGYRIWPEYRLHSIVFALRSLSMMLIIWLERKNEWEPQHLWNAGIVFATLALADAASWYVGPNGRSNTIREVEAPPLMRYAFSVMQFHATMGVMLGVRRFSTQFIYVWIIQLNAFLMTLRRKNLAPHMALVSTYGVMLAFGFVVCSYEANTIGAFLMVNTLGNTAAVVRLGLRVNKYVLWTSIAVLTHFGRQTLEQLAPPPPMTPPRPWWRFWAKPVAIEAEMPQNELFPYWPLCYALSLVGVFVVGFLKISRAHYAEIKEAKDKAASR